MQRIIEKLESLGVKISLKNDNLSLNAPKGVLTEELKNELALKKESLIEYLKEKETRTYPLSFSQKRMWFLYNLNPLNPAYNIFSAFKVKGKLDKEILKKSINEVIKRHDSLRAYFVIEDNLPVQKIVPFLKIEIENKNITSELNYFKNIDELILKEVDLSFNLEKLPLIKIKMLEISENENIFIPILHHIIADAWSCGIFIKEVIDIYKAFSLNKEIDLIKIDNNYLKYIENQEKNLNQESISFWKKELNNIPSFIQMPTDKKRPKVNNFIGTIFEIELPEEIKIGIKELSKKYAITPFIFFISAYQLLIHRFTHEEIVPIGFPIVGRNEKIYENLIGLFVNTLVFKTDFSLDITFEELLKNNWEKFQKILENQDLPFEKVLESLIVQRNTSYTPIFQHFFVMQNIEFPNLEFDNINFELLNIHNGTSKFDLTFTIKNNESTLSIEYNRDIFEEDNIKSFSESYFEILKSLIKNPKESISKVNIISENQYNIAFNLFNNIPK